MDLEKIKNLMAAMEERKITKLALKEKSGIELELERDPGFRVEPYSKPQEFHNPAEHVPAQEPALEEKVQPKEEEKVVETSASHHITSPMVGTFYGSPSPEDPNFVKVGDTVDEDTVVCIIEAMKVMNEVKAGVKGKVEEILVDNANPVEFGTKLFRLVEA